MKIILSLLSYNDSGDFIICETRRKTINFIQGSSKKCKI